MSSPVRFQLDRRVFGRVRFPRARGETRVKFKIMQTALQTCFGVRVRLKRDGWWFGPRVAVLDFMGERIKVRAGENGDAVAELGHMDDEVRETILAYLSRSLDFDGR